MYYLVRALQGTVESFSNVVKSSKQIKNKKTYSRGFKKIRMFYDIETYVYNKGADKATEKKSAMYSFAVGVYDDPRNNEGNLNILQFPNFVHFHRFMKDIGVQKQTKIELIAHNADGFDNHFISYEMTQFLNAVPYNAYNRNLQDDSIDTTTYKEEAGYGYNFLLESRVRSKTKLRIEASSIDNIQYHTIDNLPKYGCSLASVGDSLLYAKLISEEDLKTDMNYAQYDVDYDMTPDEAFAYSEKIFTSLENKPDDQIYMKNDIVLLANSCKYYSFLNPGFDYEKMTKTQNIKIAYEQSPLSFFQLEKKYLNETTDKWDSIQFSNFRLNETTNLFDWCKKFYKGGLNFYNDKFVGKIVKDMFSIDINSSYPFVMFREKIPTIPKMIMQFDNPQKIDIDFENKDYWTMYQIKKATFDKILYKVKSKTVRKMLVKYYNLLITKQGGETKIEDYVYINSNTLRMLNDLFGVKVKSMFVKAYWTWKCEYFASRDILAKFYRLKTQGKYASKGTVFFGNNDTDPTECWIDESKPYEGEQLSEEQIAVSKVLMNGLYGMPGLSSTFKYGYRLDNSELAISPNGFKNNERNVLFSAFVTSQALYNLLEPLKYLNSEQIDEYFVYCDTDSLYLKLEAKELIDKSIYHPLSLGKWDIENEHILKFYPLNHKKYAYTTTKEKYKKTNNPEGIQIRCGGVNKDSFNFNMTFEKFIDTQFSEGKTINNVRGIMNVNNTITIYNSKMELKMGTEYPEFYNPEKQQEQYDIIVSQINENTEFEENGDSGDQLLYIETPWGAFSEKELFPFEENLPEPHMTPEKFVNTYNYHYNTSVKKQQELYLLNKKD